MPQGRGARLSWEIIEKPRKPVFTGFFHGFYRFFHGFLPAFSMVFEKNARKKNEKVLVLGWFLQGFCKYFLRKKTRENPDFTLNYWENQWVFLFFFSWCFSTSIIVVAKGSLG